MNAKRSNPSLVELVDFQWKSAPMAIWVPPSRHAQVFTRLMKYWAEAAEGCAEDDPFGIWLASASEGARAYEPLREFPALFREFAELRSEADFLAFAHKYGALRDVANGPRSSLALWLYESQTMRAAVRLFESLETGNVEEVLSETVWTDETYGTNEERFLFPELRREIEGADRFDDDSPFQAFQDADYGGQAALPVTSSARHIAQTALALGIKTALLQHGVTPSVVPDGSPFRSGLRLSFNVPDLAGAMWLQLALAVDGNRKYQKCEVCETWQDVTDWREDRVVCSDKCRAAKSYRLRKGAAATKGGAR